MESIIQNIDSGDFTLSEYQKIKSCVKNKIKNIQYQNYGSSIKTIFYEKLEDLVNDKNYAYREDFVKKSIELIEKLSVIKIKKNVLRHMCETKILIQIDFLNLEFYCYGCIDAEINIKVFAGYYCIGEYQTTDCANLNKENMQKIYLEVKDNLTMDYDDFENFIEKLISCFSRDNLI
jgi:hypothetical protein